MTIITHSYYTPYIGTSEAERKLMIDELGIQSINELFSDLPEEILLTEDLDIPGPMSEQELLRFFTAIAAKNNITTTSFCGGGVRQQYIPAALQELMRRGELYTAYTPYQPEISQGMLQLLYEYQSLLAELLAMDVVNASMYDWGSALGETLRIMKRLTKRSKVLITKPVSPQRLEVARSYIKYANIELVVIEEKDGNVDHQKLLEFIQAEQERDKKAREFAGLYIEVPTYFGTLPERIEEIVNLAHEVDMLVTIGVDPLSLGVLKPPGEYNADFVVGEGQMLGNAISTGGPLLGILASKYDRKLIRQVPGRLIGKTKELLANTTGYCITLSTREQHIRREKATSNICSNQAITAVNAAIYLSSLGRQGIIELAQSLHDRAHYLASSLSTIEGVIAPLFTPFFSEFVVEFTNISREKLEKYCHDQGVIPGIALDETKRLISASELHTKEDLDRLVTVIEELMR